MTTERRLGRLEQAARVKVEAIPEDEFTFQLRVKAVNDLLGKYGVPPMTGDEFRVFKDAVKAAGGVEAYRKQWGHP